MGQQTTYSNMPALGYSGTVDKSQPYSTLTMKNTEASAAIRFGVAVKRNGSPTTDLDALLPTVETDKVVGIVERLTTYSRVWTDELGNTVGQLNATGLVPSTLMSVVTSGRMLVECRTGCTAGQGLWVRAVAAGAEYLGALENADDSTDMIDCTTQAKWETSAAAGGLAWLRFDFTNI
jgi:hypothetical protein